MTAQALAYRDSDFDALATRAIHNPDARCELVDRLLPLIDGTTAHALRSGMTYGIIERDDLHQQAFYYLLYLIPRYDPALGHAIQYFVFRVRSKMLMYVRSEVRKRVRLIEPVSPDVIQPPIAPPDRIDLGWEYTTQRALEALSQAHRNLLQLAYVYDLSDLQIAQLTGRNVPSVRQQRYRALRRMKELL